MDFVRSTNPFSNVPNNMGSNNANTVRGSAEPLTIHLLEGMSLYAVSAAAYAPVDGDPLLQHLPRRRSQHRYVGCILSIFLAP
jgi:hypothetical protein